MRINTNVAALNSYNQLKNTQNNLSKSLERLSSGKRINGAADDAAGLAISEKMNAQVRGLGQAQRNAQDGISMIQTAEGALKESHSILQRMRELAVQSANDTNTQADRAEIQKEVDQLAGELSRISNTTEFNTQSLLNGAITEDAEGEAVFQIGSNENQNLSISMGAMDASTLGAAEDVESVSAVTSNEAGNLIGVDLADGQTLEEGNYSVETSLNADGSTYDIALKNSNDEIIAEKNGVAAGTGSAVTLQDSNTEDVATVNFSGAIDDTSAADVAIGASGADLTAGTNFETTQLSSTDALDEGTYTVTVKNDGTNDDILELTDSDGKVVGTHDTGGTAIAASTSYDITLDEGGTMSITTGATAPTSTSPDTATIEVTQSDYESGSSSAAKDSDGDGKIDTDATVAKGIDVRTQSNANDAIEVLDKSIASVSQERSKLGAYQNRLEHTINNLNTAQENLTAAESRISDVDMAREMMNMSKQQILSQAGTAMMAQANQLPQGVLQLLG